MSLVACRRLRARSDRLPNLPELALSVPAHSAAFPVSSFLSMFDHSERAAALSSSDFRHASRQFKPHASPSRNVPGSHASAGRGDSSGGIGGSRYWITGVAEQAAQIIGKIRVETRKAARGEGAFIGGMSSV